MSANSIWAGCTLEGRRFQLIRLIGQGGLGLVFEAFDRLLERTVALKHIKGKYARVGTFRRQFVWEAKLTAHFDHPNIIPLLDVGTLNCELPYYLMPLIQGQSFRQLFDQVHETTNQSESNGVSPQVRSSRLRRLLSGFMGVFSAVQHAHRLGVIHGDLKPGNIMLNHTGVAKVIDWGLGRTFDLEVTESKQVTGRTGPRSGFLSRQGETLDWAAGMGSPSYMSPEQSAGLSGIGSASDIYSLGGVLFALLSNRQSLDAEERERCLDRIGRGDEVSPLEQEGLVSSCRPLAAIARKALDRDPTRRYPSVGEMSARFEEVLDDLKISANELMN